MSPKSARRRGCARWPSAGTCHRKADTDLIEALHFLMVLKLDNNLRQRRSGQPVNNLVQLSTLGTLERDLMKDSLAIIKAFRQHLRLLYRLDFL